VVVVADEREVKDTRWCPSQVGPRSELALALAGVAPKRVVVVATRSVEAIKSAVRFGRPVTLIPRWKSGPTHHRNLKTRERKCG
jgi:DNA-binding transcriptional LysR family regulator